MNVPRLWFCLEPGDYWFGTRPPHMRDRPLTLFRASDVRSPIDISQAARLIAASDRAMEDLAWYSGADQARLHGALARLAEHGVDPA